MEATCSSETSVDIQQTACRYTPEDITRHNHCCESFESYYDKIVGILDSNRAPLE
jgi:hypothetical protein